ncbi:hypothetical protein [Pengzhenrongella phosphoraccumulans]|uniref:hypothetical protein n=1 Tax=Pengzhenrongella phosphoraccumulans TaxID=3114394 RepID=UPI00388DADBA
MASVRLSRPSRPWSRPLAAGMVALAAVAITGCSPLTTTKPYAPSDGVRVVLGSTFSAANLLIISEAEGEPGVLVGGLTNKSDSPISVTLSPKGATEATVRVPAGETVLLGGDNDPPLEIDKVGVAPGAVLPMTISTRDGGSEDVSIPVLDGTLPQYANLVPTAG